MGEQDDVEHEPSLTETAPKPQAEGTDRPSASPVGKPVPGEAGASVHGDELLDESLTETFPASDPITRGDFR